MTQEERIKVVVKKLGIKNIQNELGLKPNAITNWYKQEVPVRYVIPIIEMLKKEGIYMIPDVLNSNLKFKNIYKDYFNSKDTI